jgi:AraC-like DNA-binding protein
LNLPRPLAYGVLTFCVGGAAWLWLAARALFDDDFGWHWPEGLVLAVVLLVGLAANVPYFPAGDGPFRTFAPGSPVAWLGHLHTGLMLACSVAALAEVARGWRSDLVEARRAARRWVALGIGVYSALALTIELAVQNQPVGPWLPALHVAGIGLIALGLALLVARHSLPVVLGPDPAPPAPLAPLPEAPTAPPPPAGPARPPRHAAALARLEEAMSQDRLYRREGLTLADLAAHLGLGEAALRELINQHLGYRNFNDFLHHHRLAEAAERLLREDLPILSIALDCGYGSIGPFNRAFKQRLGLTPSEYRAAGRLAPPAPP